MAESIIDKYLNYKKNRLVAYATTIFSDTTNQEFLEKTYQKYITNYIEVYYYHIFSTVENINKQPTLDLFLQEQTGIELEQLEQLKDYELIDSNEVYQQKYNVISFAKNICLWIAKLDRKYIKDYKEIPEILKQLVEKETKIKELLTPKIIEKLQVKIKETLKVEQGLQLENSIFTLKENELKKHLSEIKLNYYSKKLSVNYKNSLVERVYQEEEVEVEKTTLLVEKLLLELVKSIINKKEVTQYIIEIKDAIFNNKEALENIFSLLNDPISKENIFLGVTYTQYTANKIITAKKSAGYQFACYQDFTYINDYSMKMTAIESAQVFDYIVITGYKDKEFEWLKKYTPTIVKEILFSKEV